jgi:hypothetical protein
MERALKYALVGLASATFSLGISPSASAQVLGTQGDAVFGAERLFGIRGERVYEEPPIPEPEREWNHTVISFGLSDTAVPFNIPRLTFDYLVVNKVSVGGALGFSTADSKPRGGGSNTTTRFVLAPRAGYLHMFGRVAGIWPRAGLTYHRVSAERNFVESAFGLNLECNFPLVFTPHFGMLVGLAFDQSFLGNRDPVDRVDYFVSYRSFGLQIGLFGWI